MNKDYYEKVIKVNKSRERLRSCEFETGLRKSERRQQRRQSDRNDIEEAIEEETEILETLDDYDDDFFAE